MFNFLSSIAAPRCPYPDDCVKLKLRLREDINEEEAIVDELIAGPNQKGRVRFQGTWWPARCNQEMVLVPGQRVRVVGINRITLLVEPFWGG